MAKNRRFNTTKPFDGEYTKKRWWDWLFISDYSIALADDDGSEHEYTVRCDYLSTDATLFRDGQGVAKGTTPVSFDVPGGHIEAALGWLGIQRMHVVPEADPTMRGSLSESVKREVRAVRREVDPSKVFDFEGEDGEVMLRPTSDTIEYVRLWADRRFPRLSRAVSIGAVVVLLGALAIAIPQAIEGLLATDLAQQYLGWDFTSPIQLTAGANAAVGVAGFIAAFERALTMRYNKIVDADPWWL